MQKNAVINYDWYHPQNCFRYTVKEMEDWFKKVNLTITHNFTDEFGITMHRKK